MKIVTGKPPNYQKIVERFGPLSPTIVFTYGDTIYCSSPFGISDHVSIHESVHVRQQREIGGADVWWELYLTNKEFRLKQELEAYRVQWDYIRRTRGRKESRELLDHICTALSSHIYGGIVNKKKAKELILEPST